MRSLQKVVSVISCGFLLWLGLSQPAQEGIAASAADKLKAEQSDRRLGGQAAGETQMREMGAGQSAPDRIIQGEVLRVDGNDCVVRSQSGKEVQLHIDATTLNAGNVEPGQHIEAKVDKQNHALSILSADRRNDKQ